jgi:hypothetical protein
MWQRRSKEMNKVQECAKLLSSPNECRKAMLRAVNEYPISAEQHLTKSMGKRPWVGQAACCVEIGATEEETRVAWNFYMSAAQQDSANAIADSVISDWEINNA